MDTSPNLRLIVQTKRLQLTEMLNSDREEVLRLFCQIDPTASIWDNKAEDIRETLRDIIWKEINRDTFNCIIRDHKGVFMGRICMLHLTEACPAIGIELFEPYRNQGYGPESLSAFVAWFKDSYGKRKIMARIKQDNTHSKHVFEKLGAVYVGVDTELRAATLKRLKEVMPEADISGLEIKDVLLYSL